MEGLRLTSPVSGWSNDLDWRLNGFSNLADGTHGLVSSLTVGDLSCCSNSATERPGDWSKAVTIVESSFWDVASWFHACRSAVWIHLFWVRSTGVRPHSSTTFTSAFRRRRIDVECSWPSCAFDYNIYTDKLFKCYRMSTDILKYRSCRWKKQNIN